MQDFFTSIGFAPSTQALAGHTGHNMPRFEAPLVRLILQSARGLRASEATVFSRRRPNPAVAASSKRSSDTGSGEEKKPRRVAEADLRDDLNHFLGRETTGLRAKLDS